jgi:hypothetical protein
MPISPEAADAVRADDELVERLNMGGPPPVPDDELCVLLTAWRDVVRRRG